jgi:DNA-binding transcriptional regulator YhcF (GntR family)
MRCANRLKDNICYPSVKNIAKNCSISSETTVSKAIKELETRGLITKNNTGRNNIYKIEEAVYLAIDKANKKDQDTSVLEATPTHSGGIESEEKGVLTIPSHSDGTQPPSDGKYHHHMVPNNTNIIKLNNNKEEENNRYDNNFSISTKEKNIENIKIPCRDMDVDRRICKKIERDRKNRLLNITGSYKEWAPDNKALIKKTIDKLLRKTDSMDTIDLAEKTEGFRKKIG